MTLGEVQGLDGKAVLVTGGAGFIGSHLVEAVAAAGAKVTVVDDLRTGSRTNLKAVGASIEVLDEDVLGDRFSTLVKARRFDAIFHCAGNAYIPPSVEDPWNDFQANAVGTLKLLETLRRAAALARLVVFSSGAVYGDIDSGPIGEAAALDPISPYGVSKLAAERYAAVYARLYGLRVASVRLFSVYGPRQRKQVVYDFIQRLRASPRELQALGDGSQVRDFNYVTDVVRAVTHIAAAGALRGETYNVGTGEGWSIRDLVRVLCELMDIRPAVHWSGATRPGDPERWIVDAKRLRVLGWQPTVSFREGLSRTLVWYDATGAG